MRLFHALLQFAVVFSVFVASLLPHAETTRAALTTIDAVISFEKIARMLDSLACRFGRGVAPFIPKSWWTLVAMNQALKTF